MIFAGATPRIELTDLHARGTEIRVAAAARNPRDRGEKITFQRMDYNAQVSYEDSKDVTRTDWSETYSIHGAITNETIVAREGEVATHEGLYEIKSFLRGPSHYVTTPVSAKIPP